MAHSATITRSTSSASSATSATISSGVAMSTPAVVRAMAMAQASGLDAAYELWSQFELVGDQVCLAMANTRTAEEGHEEEDDEEGGAGEGGIASTALVAAKKFNGLFKASSRQSLSKASLAATQRRLSKVKSGREGLTTLGKVATILKAARIKAHKAVASMVSGGGGGGGGSSGGSGGLPLTSDELEELYTEAARAVQEALLDHDAPLANIVR